MLSSTTHPPNNTNDTLDNIDGIMDLAPRQLQYTPRRSEWEFDRSKM